MTQSNSSAIPASRSGKTAMDVTLEAAGIAGKIIRDRFKTTKEITFKGRADLVTDVDLAVEKAVLEFLQDQYPDFGVLSEESAPIESDSPYTWVVDPVDGTRNYAMGIPHFCTVVALARGDQVLLGATYDPMKDEMFTAEAGKGSFLNGERLVVSQRQEMEEALLCFDIGGMNESGGFALDMLRSLWQGVQGFRLLGSAALGMAYAAAGRVDLYFHHALSPWDSASGLLIAREAGGDVVDRQGQSANLFTPSVIVSSPRLIERFLQATDGLEWRQ